MNGSSKPLTNWDRLFNDVPFTSQQFHPSRLLIPQLAVGTTLECGCACALDFQLFKQLGKSYRGIDITTSFLAKAPNRVCSYGSILEIPYADKSFDTVYCRHVLEHLPKQCVALAIAEMQRVARKIIACTFFLAPLESGEVLSFDGEDGFHNNTYSQHDIADQMRKFGAVSIADFRYKEDSADESVVFVADGRIKTT